LIDFLVGVFYWCLKNPNKPRQQTLSDGRLSTVRCKTPSSTSCFNYTLI
jgi:hypothetical protein